MKTYLLAFVVSACLVGGGIHMLRRHNREMDTYRRLVAERPQITGHPVPFVTDLPENYRPDQIARYVPVGYHWGYFLPGKPGVPKRLYAFPERRDLPVNEPVSGSFDIIDPHQP